MTLSEFFKENPKCAIAFSGGTDSAYLVCAAKRCGADITAYYIKTTFQPEFEYRDAVRLCNALNVKMKTTVLDILSKKSVAENPKDRCYHCKKALFSALLKNAHDDGYTVICDGTNASDDASDRPGMKALAELSVRSPLRECGLTKDEIRMRSKNAGLFTWDKPAYACLATRIPCGMNITADLLEKIECSENALAAMGFSDFRVRMSQSGTAKLQIKAGQFTKAAEKRADIVKCLKPYFDNILLDMETR